jgi:hypothetical protein
VRDGDALDGGEIAEGWGEVGLSQVSFTSNVVLTRRRSARSRFPPWVMRFCQLQITLSKARTRTLVLAPLRNKWATHLFCPGCACCRRRFLFLFLVSLKIEVGLLWLTTSGLACLMRRQTYVVLAALAIARWTRKHRADHHWQLLLGKDAG